MSSTTGLPERPPPTENEVRRVESEENEPLLGRPGDAIQHEDASFAKNLYIGTGALAQIGAVILVVLVWYAVFANPLMLFSAHPLLQSAAVLVLIQSVLLLQPTSTAEQKRMGQRFHASLNLVAFLLLVAGVVVIEYNKIANGGPHFHSVHGYLGVITSVFLLLQYLVGFTMWATPALYGGEHNARSIWKYHRYSGYLVLLLLLATVCSATQTSYNFKVLDIKLWATILASVLVVLGIFPRIQKQKLGLGSS